VIDRHVGGPCKHSTVELLPVDTPHGVAHAHVRLADRARAVLVLGHGAGGGVTARDLVTTAGAALAVGVSVALVEQPYRVAGRRSPAPAHQLDTAWLAVVEYLRSELVRGLPLVVGGRSSGARVACRTAAAAEASGVLCLAFPLQPPRRTGTPQSRIDELDAVTVPTLVVQGVRDPFGMPPAAPLRTVVQVQGDHSLRTDLAAVGEAVRAWLADLLERHVGPKQAGKRPARLAGGSEQGDA
jgi:predicted alpha/beta-hydrolase family hydrolase